MEEYMAEEKKSVFYGWWIVVGGFVLCFFGIGMGINTVGIFIEEVVSTLNFTRGGFSLFFTIAAITMMIGAIIVGKLMEKIDVRVIMGVGTSLFAFGFALYSQCETLKEFYLTSVLLGLGSAGTHIIPVTTMINNWFVKKRGLAMGIVFAGTGIGGLVLNPFMTWIITNNFLNMKYGWQSAFIIGGVSAAVFCIPIAVFVMKKSPGELGLMPDGVEAGGVTDETALKGFSLGETVKTPVFWIVAGMALLFSVVNMGINQHLYSYFNADMGFAKTTASMIVGGYLGMTVFGKISIGHISDRKGLIFGMILFISMVLVGIIILINAKYLWIAVFFISIFGFGNVIQTVIPPLVTAECFGLLHYGVIYGIVSVFMTIGAGIGTPLSGFIRDKTGSYHGAYFLYIGLLIFSLILGVAALKRAHFKREIA